MTGFADSNWRGSLLVQGVLVFVAVIAFQLITRGEIEPLIAVVVPLGYLAVAWLVGRRRERSH